MNQQTVKQLGVELLQDFQADTATLVACIRSQQQACDWLVQYQYLVYDLTAQAPIPGYTLGCLVKDQISILYQQLDQSQACCWLRTHATETKHLFSFIFSLLA